MTGVLPHGGAAAQDTSSPWQSVHLKSSLSYLNICLSFIVHYITSHNHICTLLTPSIQNFLIGVTGEQNCIYLLPAVFRSTEILPLIDLSVPSAAEALLRQEEDWLQEVEETLSVCASLSHPSRPRHIDFLRITAPEDDIIDTPSTTPLPPEFWVSDSEGLLWRRIPRCFILSCLAALICKCRHYLNENQIWKK